MPKNVKTQYPSSNKVDIREAAIHILSTLQQLEGSYGANYLVQILKGDTRFELKKPRHEKLETFGTMTAFHSRRVHNLISYLLNQDFISVTDSRFGTLSMADKGQEFLRHPSNLVVKTQDLKQSVFDKMLTAQLKKIRQEFCETENLPPFRIFTDYAIQRVVQDRPKSLEDLKSIPGIGNFKAQKFGDEILKAVEWVQQQQEHAEFERRIQKAYSPSHQEVKALFESGFSTEEIAEKRNVKPLTIKIYLENLQLAGEIEKT